MDIYREASTGNERDNRILQALSGSIRHGHTHTPNLGNFNLSEANFIAHTFIESDNSTKGHFFQLHRRFLIIRRSGIGNSVEKQSGAFMLRLRLHQRKISDWQPLNTGSRANEQLHFHSLQSCQQNCTKTSHQRQALEVQTFGRVSLTGKSTAVGTGSSLST